MSYYFLSVAIALTLFFLIWAIFIESGDSSAFIPAGIVSGVFLIAAFVLREILLRRLQASRLDAQRRLDKNLQHISSTGKPRTKLTLQRNQRMLRKIQEKSMAAGILAQVAEAHWEAFQLCDNYLKVVRKEMAQTHVNSPRFGPINKGRGKIKKLHRFHLLEWAKSKAGDLTLDSKGTEVPYESRITRAESALLSLSTALDYYPRDKNLLESHEAIKEFISTIKVSHKIDQAERASFSGERRLAITLYRDALFSLNSEFLRKREKNEIAEKINLEIRKLRGA